MGDSSERCNCKHQYSSSFDKQCLQFAAMAFQSPVIIPNTPPNMQARLDQLLREKEGEQCSYVIMIMGT